MKKLPEYNDIGIERNKDISTFTSPAHKELVSTENILKRLLINIEAFKRIEQENSLIKKELIQNQFVLKREYKRKLDELNYVIKEKNNIETKVKTELLIKYKKYLENLSREIIKQKQENNVFRKKYKELFDISRKTSDDNKKLRLILLHNKDLIKLEFQRKLKQIMKEHSDNKTLSAAKHKMLLKEYENRKLDMTEKLESEKQKNEFLIQRYGKIKTLLEQREKEYKTLINLNKKIIQRLAFLEKNSLGNEQVLEARTQVIKQAFEDKLKEITKIQITKEVDYKAKISSLMEDLAKYYDELKESKRKYYTREKELKEKLKEILN